jgi:hypothetical protein
MDSIVSRFVLVKAAAAFTLIAARCSKHPKFGSAAPPDPLEVLASIVLMQPKVP